MDELEDDFFDKFNKFDKLLEVWFTRWTIRQKRWTNEMAELDRRDVHLKMKVDDRD